MQPDRPPTGDQVSAFLADLRSRGERLRRLAPGDSTTDYADLVGAIDDVGEQLLVADEELRVQAEHLAESTQELERLATAHEELFANSSTAYLQTDADGVLLRYNHAARRLLGLPGTAGCVRTLFSLVADRDRRAVRNLVSGLRATAGDPALPAVADTIGDRIGGRIEVAVHGAGGGLTPVVLCGRRARDPLTGSVMLHWELREHGAAPASSPQKWHRAGASGATRGAGDRLRAIARAAADMAGQDCPAETLHHVAQQAIELVPGCDEVGVTVVRSRGRLETCVTTGELAEHCERLYRELGEGPAPDAIGGLAPVRVANAADDRRWPAFAAAASQAAAAGILALPMTGPRGLLGALTLYGRAREAFDDEDELVATALATHAGIAVAHAELEANLRTGLQTREEIGRAVGILMERHRVTAKAAFDMLVVVSQHSHRKLREIAVQVNETGEDPAALLRRRRIGQIGA